MNRWNVAILGINVEEAALEEAARRLTSAWPPGRLPAFAILQEQSSSTQEPEQFDAMVIVSRQPASESRVLRLLSNFEECSVPVLALLEGPAGENNPFALAGALAADLNEADAVLAAMLNALLHRQQEVKRLRTEMSVAQRFQGGLNGQIAKMHDELRLAALIQRDLLPAELPQVHGVEVAALWRPVNYVSGDIYDVMRLDEDHIGIFLADAVGHGVPAALMTMVLCHAIRMRDMTRAGGIIRPADVLTRLNASLIERQGGHTRFATAVYAVLDCRRRVLTLAGAGHPPPLHLHGDGVCTELATEGGLLGVFPDETYAQIEIELCMGDRLLFFSDGFEQAFPHPATDPRPRGAPTTRYRQEFAALAATRRAADMIDVMNHRLDSQRGSLHQIDDLTLVCVLAGSLSPLEPDQTESAAHQSA